MVLKYDHLIMKDIMLRCQNRLNVSSKVKIAVLTDNTEVLCYIYIYIYDPTNLNKITRRIILDRSIIAS
jgi:hypothetical protein